MADAASLTAHTGYWLRMVSNEVSQEFARKVAEEGVTVAEWSFMRSLYDVDAMAPSALAAKMGLSKGAISKLADRLIDKTLVARAENDEDRRGHSLSLTSAGRGKVPALAALADKNDAEYFDVLTTDEHATLLALLKALADRRGLKTIPVN
ncbi:MarR family transcriptional regulator [Aquibium sp. ELW1220]|jgi:DNA-binding MarR family transcriptional regulator|uniref:MarR family winged helix-turn-helix transcriptional regulator n=1 Tax=Aquibium sp. ELW1220 TaxID=2976766 RepID=UPI0025B2688A|nr:MarR family transcriptional regulator [Aquibium sp. ELW1220]MDN2579685.1 MarR family transcriptional regulator [Aquibium sp. ELW1220]